MIVYDKQGKGLDLCRCYPINSRYILSRVEKQYFILFEFDLLGKVTFGQNESLYFIFPIYRLYCQK